MGKTDRTVNLKKTKTNMTGIRIHTDTNRLYDTFTDHAQVNMQTKSLC